MKKLKTINKMTLGELTQELHNARYRLRLYSRATSRGMQWSKRVNLLHNMIKAKEAKSENL